jgi:hypothetical protein
LWREKLKQVRNMKVTKKTLICAKHFEERFLKREHVLENKRSGSVELIPKKNLTLLKHAYPSVFEAPPEGEADGGPEPIGEVVLADTHENDASSQDETTLARRSTRKRRKPRKFLKIKPKKIKKELETDVEEELFDAEDDDNNDEIFGECTNISKLS